MRNVLSRVCILACALGLLGLVSPATSAAEEEGGKKGTESGEVSVEGESSSQVALEIVNPLRRIWVLSNQFDNFFVHGEISPEIRPANIWLFQPVLPVPLPGGWLLVNRPILQTIIHAELPQATPRGVTFRDVGWEIGDLVYLAAFGRLIPSTAPILGKGILALGAGPTFLFPVATIDALGTGKYSAGPSAAAAFMGKNGVLGVLYQQWFSFAGDSERRSVNLINIQPFYFVNFKDGWQLGGAPIITGNLKAKDDNGWNVPIGIGGFKTTFFGPLPIRIGVEYEWSVVHEETYGNRWDVRVIFAPVIPSLIHWPWEPPPPKAKGQGKGQSDESPPPL